MSSALTEPSWERRTFWFNTPWPGTWKFQIKNWAPATHSHVSLYSPKGDLVFFDAQAFRLTGKLVLQAVEEDTYFGPWLLRMAW